MDNSGIVYVLKNAAMPGIVKIGFTQRTDAKTRMNELYTSGVPVPFECVYAARVSNFEKVEKALHTAFSPHRINPKREFFSIEANQAIVIIKLLEIENLTPQVIKESEEVDIESREAAEQLKKKRPNFNFVEMGIPIGSEIVSTKSSEIAIIKTPKTVTFRNEEMSLTRATILILDIDYSIAPGPYWTYNGKYLRDIYNETYQLPE
jgi:hypothetical protein